MTRQTLLQTDLRAGLVDVYRRLYEAYGPQHWWPGGDDPWEVIVGAILTQNTAWINAERALMRLKEENALSPQRIRDLSKEKLASFVHSSGYFNTKARKLKAFAEHIGTLYGDDLDILFSKDSSELRDELLSIYGIGDETADDILVYAARTPSFVIDTYTRRILTRLCVTPRHHSYQGYQSLFHNNLDWDLQLFNEYHALLDKHAGEVCKVNPLCTDCCLYSICPTGWTIAEG